MTDPLVLQLPLCEDEALSGGKAAGLVRLLKQGFRVPPAVCLTTAAYDVMLREAAVDVTAIWPRLRAASEEGRRRLLAEIRTALRRTAMPVIIERARFPCRRNSRKSPRRYARARKASHTKTGDWLAHCSRLSMEQA